jgi:hypothetical protein
MSLKNKRTILSYDSKGIAIALVLSLAILYAKIGFGDSSKNEPKELKKEAVKLFKACPVFVVNLSDQSLLMASVKEQWSSFGSVDFKIIKVIVVYLDPCKTVLQKYRQIGTI